MPTISVRKRLLDKHLKHCYSREELDDLCFAYGLEIDDVSNELDDNEREIEIYKIEIPANRYDLLCVEGLCRAFLLFQERINSPSYNVVEVKQPRKIIVESNTTGIRPYVVGAILRNIKMDKDIYASFIDLQDKLHQNICRKRLLASIGTHDLDKIKGNIRYCARVPESIVFEPLNQTREYNSAELMNLYSDGHLREYLPIIRNKELYPVFYDEDNVVLSLPPIINGNKTKITLDTSNIFIEMTGLNLKKLEIVLETVVTMFSQYCLKPFTVEPVEVHYPDNIVHKYPILRYREIEVNVQTMNSKIGISLTNEKASLLLSRMGFNCIAFADPLKLKVNLMKN